MDHRHPSGAAEPMGKNWASVAGFNAPSPSQPAHRSNTSLPSQPAHHPNASLPSQLLHQPTEKTWSNVAASPPKPSPLPNPTKNRVNLKTTKRPQSMASFTFPFAGPSTRPSTPATPAAAASKAPAVAMASDKMEYTGLEWPAKVPKEPSYDVDPAHVAADNEQYAREKAQNVKKGLPAQTGNGLLDALKAFQSQSEKGPETFSPQATFAPKEGSAFRAGGIRAAIAAAARDAAARSGSRKTSVATARRVDAFNAGKRIDEAGVPYTTAPKEKKPIIPFDHKHAKCQNWLNEFDPIAVVAPKLSTATKHREELRDLVNQHTVELARQSYAAGAAPSGSIECPFLNTDGIAGNVSSHKQSEDAHDDSAPYDGDVDEDSFEDEDDAVCYKEDYEYDDEDGIATDGQSSTSKGHQALYYPNKVGHSSSKSWVAPLERERARWEKISADMSRARTHRSPFVPKTFEEYLAHKKTVMQVKCAAKEKKMAEKVAMMDSKMVSLEEGMPVEQGFEMPAKISAKLASFEQRDGLTAVNARISMWTELCRQCSKIDWPTRQEFKEGGDDRAKAKVLAKERIDRFLPEPRMQRLDEELAARENNPNAIPKKGPYVPRKLRKVAHFVSESIRYDGLTVQEAAIMKRAATEEFDTTQVPQMLQHLLEEIYNEDD
ncbi:hypothetical protein GGR56DRAFT_613357 [Xylariaceae sp. FL0804]|nr:hypothetical protein GGR56DRAFT_613357 [Xylariaceae sp. FL0804]